MFKSQLIQPRMLVQWGDLELTIDVDRPDFSPLISASMSFQDSEAYPTCTLDFSGDTIGYEAYRKCISEENRDKPIVISLGYPRGSWFSAQFYYAGASLGSGNSWEISISGSSKTKDLLSAFKTNVSLETTLEQLPKKIQETVAAAGSDAKQVATEFSPLAREVASQTKLNGVIGTGQSPATMVYNQLRNQGLEMDLTATANPTNPRAQVYAPALANAQKGEGQPKDAALATQISLGDESYGFLLGPGLLRDMNRSISWGPDSGQGANTTPANLMLPVGAEPRDTTNPESPAVKPTAPAGWDAPSTAYTVTEESNPSLGLDLKKLKEIQDKFTCSGSFFMVPAVVGIKPRDFLFLPSLRNDYLEDWFLDSVSYNFGADGCQISFSGYRLALDPSRKMVDTATYNEFLKKLKGMVKVEDWENYYWRVSSQ